jgi:hypothetical protein
MIINFKFLSLPILAVSLNCNASTSITHDRGGWDKTTIARPEDDSASAPQQNYINRKEVVTFKVYADLDIDRDTYTVITKNPVVRGWEESNFIATASGLTPQLAQQLREVRIAHYAKSLTDMYTTKPFDASEKAYLAELAARLATK